MFYYRNTEVFFINKVFIFLNEYILGTKKIAKYPTTL